MIETMPRSLEATSSAPSAQRPVPYRIVSGALRMSGPSLSTRIAGKLPPMPIIDSQVHAYERNTPKRPWHSVRNWPPSATGDETVAAMDQLGIDGAIFISAFSLYRYDASYAVEVQRKHPGRFALVKPVDPDNPAGGGGIRDWQ